MATSTAAALCRSHFLRISCLCTNVARSFSTMNGPLCFRATQLLCAEPPKKKKRVDPKLEMMRQQRMLKRMRKIQFKMGDPELKPIEEFRSDKKLLLDERRKREAPDLTYEEQERRALLQKDWARHKFQEHVAETQRIRDLLKAQEKALRELRAESEELYQQAVQVDQGLFPFEVTGPTYTPPIPGYAKTSPDGEYVDISKQYK
ncbi:39S ribosomal protein L40, mitochondrial-like [Acanthaster planci]|uniref:Large ribosomal subunit protein mL40 n=1 Tax=Acanthaster planci TaxID=133434 RepID=A0A8B7ZXS7_ACAPL|nr:39S ribosomal protein L40, mitochondrial-like [Acanthaster planci]